MNSSKPSFEQRLADIEARNARVERDKAWETSWVRRISIAVLTYFVVAAYLMAIDNSAPFANAFVPAAGYLLSTLVLSTIKNHWQE